MRKVLGKYMAFDNSLSTKAFEVNCEGVWRQFEADNFTNLREILKSAGIFREVSHNLIYEAKGKLKIVIDSQAKLNAAIEDCGSGAVPLIICQKSKSLEQLPGDASRPQESQQSLFPQPLQQAKADPQVQTVSSWVISWEDSILPFQ